MTFEDALEIIRKRVRAAPSVCAHPLPEFAAVMLRRHQAGFLVDNRYGSEFDFIYAWEHGSPLPFQPEMTTYVELASGTLLALRSVSDLPECVVLLDTLMRLDAGGRMRVLFNDFVSLDPDLLEASIRTPAQVPRSLFYPGTGASELRAWVWETQAEDFLTGMYAMRTIVDYPLYPELAYRAALLAAQNPFLLLPILRDELDPVVIAQIFDKLSLDLVLDLASESDRQIVRKIGLAFYLEKKPRGLPTASEEAALVRLLGISAGDYSEWDGYMEAFGRYPIAYAAMAVPIGMVLGAVCQIHMVSWLRHSDVVPSSRDVRDLYETLIATFETVASPKACRRAWCLGYDFWASAVKEYEHSLLHPRRSCIDGMLDRHFAHMSNGEGADCISELAARAHLQDRAMHSDGVAARDSHYRLLTLYQPLARATKGRLSSDPDDIYLDLLPGGESGFFGLRYGYRSARDQIARNA